MQSSMNRKQRRQAKQQSGQKSPAAYYALGRGAAMKGDVLHALEYFSHAVSGAPDNHQYKLGFCHVIKDVSFKTFNLKLKSLILTCLRAEGLDYQNLATSWFSLLMCDPNFKALQNFMEGRDFSPNKLAGNLADPYFLAGLSGLIVYELKFEAAMARLMDYDGKKPQAFDVAVSEYAARVEYVLCDVPEARTQYEIDVSIECFGLSDNAVSVVVRAQYEDNPYPRWTSIDVLKPRDENIFNHLIAGCGTGNGACSTAMMYPNAKITAVDLSLASLSYAKGKAQELNLRNIEFSQCDILKIDAPGEIRAGHKFDSIECSGVLHHMDDPLAGWRCLLSRLAEGGRMHIGLYSALGRADVVAAREIVKAGGFEPTHEGIRAARAAILDLDDDAVARGVVKRRDFYSTSSVRDLIFHTHEQRFTVARIAESLEALGLVFDGFDVQSVAVRRDYARMFPDDPKGMNLENWAKFEEQHPETFRGMYQFWCKRV